MNYKEKIKLIQNLTGLTQEEIALRLDVTFASLNRWLNDNSVPHVSSIKKINDLYDEIVGVEAHHHQSLDIKKQYIHDRKKKYKNIASFILNNPDIKDQVILSLTYNSNSIEGSTLSVNETAAVIFHNKTLRNKTLTEHLEAKNHQTAIEYLFHYLEEKKTPIDEKLILKLHSILMNGIHPDAGFYRRHGVRIIGSNVPTANYVKIPFLMEKFIGDLSKKINHVFELITIAHSKFEQIHPFGDGNGRVGRLIMNAILLKENLPPSIIEQKKKHKYYTVLNKSQLKGDHDDLEEFLIDSVIYGIRILERMW